MARTLRITNGELSVDLISNVDYGLRPDGWLQTDPEHAQVRRESVLSEGSALILSNARNVIETYTVRLAGNTHDAIAASLQTLSALKKNAREFHTTSWQTAPVYVQAQTRYETNPCYALRDYRALTGAKRLRGTAVAV